ncbi:GNAT family N-acetyltransferase [Lactobacillus sp. S2-2]|uniref:GNAT family N-acetyltransferase n=1 Tax=Lactobacillus sp. S2-2 TaxID=2692917 RepID=UPI001F221885|nr:GNAT family N-acetyltransferase [Lactobacillus sp. S2-2]MCF6515709.1 GNAT family N-acetyltransferase [Lactobacillus sp. S2-2]
MAEEDNVVIKMAEGTDAPSILDLLKQLNQESSYLAVDDNLNELTNAQEAIQIDLLNSSGKNIVLIAKINNEIIGIVSITELDDAPNEGELGVAVLEKYQNMGLGTALIDAAIDWYQNYSLLEELSLEVFNENTKAINLYIKLGFEIVSKNSIKAKMLFSN